ncbi:autotransporter outer membrane beta-barrel domain-containing protein [Bradyrhizobium tropiciagri]|uniref:autotransporter outer membrane beta-barrel domain-containing protein n=1 Tax=Bradyrhizobium tropiciagri TaxID=312253 RepID=UPI001BA9D263|nr:autotransporter outer membrane beta-barrel domain-containing protein [Bradyrhizobium tropiciagri]MBR0872914.1 autotransporter outer membrane beta-barrel domain-containing protein [Bradyrhizobium tropiciagri]
MSASVAVLAALAPRPASAQTWTGATNNDWTVGTNWSGNAAPVAGGAVNIVAGSNVVLGVTPGATGATGNLNVRDVAGGTTSLTIQNGSTLTSTGTVSVGDVAGGTASVTVTGAGSQWNAVQISLFANATSVLNVTDGATVNATSRITVGTPAGSNTATLNVSNATILLGGFGFTIANAGGQINYDNATIRLHTNSVNGSAGTAAQNNIAAGGLTIDNNGFTLLSSVGFSGVGGLTKTGAGTLLFGGSSTYAGETVIQQGTLQLNGAGSGNALASSSRVVANAEFDISSQPDANAHIQSLAGSSAGTVTLGSKDLILTNAHDTFAGTISGTGGVQVSGGTQAFSGVQAYSGATTIGGGSTLALTGAGDVSASSQVIADGTFSIAGLTGAGTSIQHLTGGGAVDLGAKTLTLTAANDTFAGVIGGAGGGLTINGTQTLTGVNTYSGTTTVDTGTLLLTGNGSIASSRVVTNGTFDISGVNAGSSQVASLAGTGTVVLGAKNLTISNANDTFAGAIGGSGGLQVAGGTQAFSGVQAYTGATTIGTSGALALTGSGSIAASSRVIANGTFSIAGLSGTGTDITRLTGSGAVDLGTKTLRILNASDTFSGVIGGSGALTINGTQTLSGVNTYSGQTLLQAGTLALSGAGSIANSSSVVANGTFDISAVSGASSSIRSLSGTGNVNLGAKTLTITAAHDTFSGGISGSGGLTLTGGTQTLFRATYTGATTIAGGTLALMGTGSLFNSSRAIVDGTLDISGITAGVTSVQRLSGSGAVNLGGKNLTILSANDSFGGVISGSGGLALAGGTQVLSGVNTYAGRTLISGGTLALTGAGSIANSSSVVAIGGFDISGIAGASTSIRSLGGNNLVTLGTKDLVISNAHDTFAGSIGGSGGLQVTGGVQSLSGSQGYTGATTISSGATLALTGLGTLALSSRVIANGTFSIAGLGITGTSIRTLSGNGAIDLGANTLGLTAANDTFAGTIGGTGGLRITGGTETLTGANSYSGTTTVAGGTLRAGAAGAFSAASAYVASGGGTLDLDGFNQTMASLDNAGTLRFGSAPGTTLTVNGNYAGNGGTLLFNTVLGGDTSPTDRLVVQGNTSGTSNVRVNNVGGGGVQTVEGIKLIDVAGASNGTFSLLGNYVLQGQQAVVAGAYAYTLQKGGASTPNDGDWYLRSSLINPPSDPGTPTPPPSAPPGPLYQPGVPLYENYAQVLLGMNMLPSMQERVGNRYWGGDPNAAMARMGGVPAASEAQSDLSWTQSAFWGRIEGGQGNMRPSNTTGSNYDADHFKAQAGLDGVALDNANGRLIVGLTAQYGLTTAYVNSFFGNGRIRVQGSGVGATATWYGDNGVYLDGQAQTMFYRGDLSSDVVGVGSLAHGNEGLGYAFSIEGGKRFGVGNGFFLTPQAQLAYSKVDFENFTDRFGALVSLDNADSLLGRVGLMLNHQKTWNDGSGVVRSDLYAIGNLHYEFLDGSRVDVSGTGFASANDRLWGSIGGGGSYSWHNGRYTVFGEATYRASLQNAADSNSYKGTAGFRVVW